MTHHQLCQRAAAWLRGNRRCEPVLTKVASCREIPDAIGWTSCYKYRGSLVVECKTSLADFYADKAKYVEFVHPEDRHPIRDKYARVRALRAAGYGERLVPNMGDYRFFLCEPGIVAAEQVSKLRPDHGLLYLDGKRLKVVIEAPRREMVDHASEVHYLRFALIHVKDNLLRVGCSVNLTELTKFFGQGGIALPGASRQATAIHPSIM